MSQTMIEEERDIYSDEEEEETRPLSQIEQLRQKGLLGSPLDFSWNGKQHTCCGSPRAYYHRVGCPACTDGLHGELKEETPVAARKPKLRAGAWRLPDETAEVMYELYTKGAGDRVPMSLEQIGRAYGKTRQAVYDIFKSRGWPLRSKQKKGLTIRYGTSFTLDGRGVLRGTKDGKRVYLHHLVWEEAHGPVPADHVLHFRDGDSQNVELANLELVPKKAMAQHFNPEKRRNDKKSWATRRKKSRTQRRGDFDWDEEENEDEI